MELHLCTRAILSPETGWLHQWLQVFLWSLESRSVQAWWLEITGGARRLSGIEQGALWHLLFMFWWTGASKKWRPVYTCLVCTAQISDHSAEYIHPVHRKNIGLKLSKDMSLVLNVQGELGCKLFNNWRYGNVKQKSKEGQRCNLGKNAFKYFP